MGKFFFSGSVATKLDEKNRFVLPQEMRYGLVENGGLDFCLALGLGGCLAIYRKSEIEKIVEKFESKQHIPKFQRFFTLFFSTLHQTSCDKIGRVHIPTLLKNRIGLEQEVVIAGVLNRIEVWPKDVYEKTIQDVDLGAAFSALEESHSTSGEEPLSDLPTPHALAEAARNSVGRL
jgi:MraZ protein